MLTSTLGIYRLHPSHKSVLDGRVAVDLQPVVAVIVTVGITQVVIQPGQGFVMVWVGVIGQQSVLGVIVSG